jgi:hypothetical protein
MAAVIEKMFDIQTGPIVEGIDTADSPDRLADSFKSIRLGHTLSLEHPIFIDGNAADFAAFNSSRLVLVYNDQQLAQLQHLTPDFHAMSLSPPVLNDAKDRGYIVWSTGWAGGTFRLVREGHEWTVLTISHSCQSLRVAAGYLGASRPPGTGGSESTAHKAALCGQRLVA